jgi:hypothetical protein
MELTSRESSIGCRVKKSHHYIPEAQWKDSKLLVVLDSSYGRRLLLAVL